MGFAELDEYLRHMGYAAALYGTYLLLRFLWDRWHGDE